MDPVTKARKHNYESVRELVLETLEQGSDYLNDEALRRWKVRCSDLDLHTGTFSDQGPAFISPYPLEKLNSILDKKSSLGNLLALRGEGLLQHVCRACSWVSPENLPKGGTRSEYARNNIFY